MTCGRLREAVFIVGLVTVAALAALLLVETLSSVREARQKTTAKSP